MPIYEYQCDRCGYRFERLQAVRDEPLRECPQCHGMVRRLIRPAGIIFKGSGFYVTDHRPQESKAESSTAEPTKKKESYETKGASAEDCG